MIKTLDIGDFVPTPTACILDVRDVEKFTQGHIAHAKNCPIDTADDQMLLSAVGDANEVFVLCGGGTKAVRAVERLEHLRSDLSIVHLAGGTRKAQALGWALVVENDN